MRHEIYRPLQSQLKKRNALRKMEQSAKFPFIVSESMPPDLRVFSENFMATFLEDAQIHAATGFPARKHVLFLDSTPGSGKTHTFKKLLKPYFQGEIASLKRKKGIDAKISHLHWDGLEIALHKMGVIKGSLKDLLPKHELATVSSVLEEITAFKLQQGVLHNATFSLRAHEAAQHLGIADFHPNELLVIEKPGSTAVRGETGWLPSEREYAPQLAEKILTGQLIPRDKLEFAALSCIGGPRMDFYIQRRSRRGEEGATINQLVEIRKVSRDAVTTLMDAPYSRAKSDLPRFVSEALQIADVTEAEEHMRKESNDPTLIDQVLQTARASRLPVGDVYLHACQRLGEPYVTLNNFHLEERDKQNHPAGFAPPEAILIYYNNPRIPLLDTIFPKTE